MIVQHIGQVTSCILKFITAGTLQKVKPILLRDMSKKERMNITNFIELCVSVVKLFKDKRAETAIGF